jgi:enoyl-CoA hydratase/carnithine racemase/mannose-6-phosphate isomerase-like protein (cupin superfamily)
MKYETLLWEHREAERVLVLTLNRPDKLNAMNGAMMRELEEAVLRAQREPGVNAILLKGAGRAFCTGYDIAPSDGGDADAIEPTLEGWRRFGKRCIDNLMTVWSCDLPVVCAVQGYALGGGLELVAACDFAVASEDAQFGEPEIRHVSAPPTLFLPWTVPSRHVRWLMYTGDMIDAQEAKRIHLVNEVVPPAELEARAMRLAARLAKVPRPAIAYNKAAVNNAQEVAGMASSMLFNVESMSAVHNTEAGRWWWGKISELGFKEFLRLREGPFREEAAPAVRPEKPAPRKIGMNDVPLLEGETSPVSIRLSRMITRANTGAGVMMGVAQMHPGERSKVFSFLESGADGPDEKWYGPIDETFFVVRGQLRVEWDGGAVEAGPQEMIHCPPGRKYRMVNPGAEASFIVYAIAPAVA